MSRTGAFIVLVLVAAAIVSWWMKASVPRTPVSKPDELEQADYFMTDFAIRQHMPDGRVHYRVGGRRLEHYPADDSAVIEAPRLSVQPERPERHWEVSARRARARSRALDEIVFEGDVDMRRPDTSRTGPMRLQTERLIIKPAAETLTGTNRVVLTGPGTRIEGVNLEADLQQGIVKLDEVRSRYAP